MVSILFLITAVSEGAPSQKSGATDRQGVFRRLVQSYVQAGKAEYDKSYFEQAVKTFHMAQGYQEYLSADEREQLNSLLEQAQTAIAQRKRALETFQTVNKLVKQDQFREAQNHLERLKDNAFLTKKERAQIAEVLTQIDVQIAEDKTHSEAIRNRKVSTTEMLEKIAEGLRAPNDAPGDRNEQIAELYRSSMKFYRAGQFEQAREGLVKVAASGLIPPAMKKTIEGYLKEIDRVLPAKKIQEVPSPETTESEMIAVLEPKVVEPKAARPELAEPKLTESGSVEPELVEPEVVTQESAAPTRVATSAPSAKAGDESYIDQVVRTRNILRDYTKTVVNNALTKARTHMGQGEFDQAKKVIEMAQYTVTEYQIHLGDALYEEYTGKLNVVHEEIIAKQKDKAQKEAEDKRAAAAEDQRRFREQWEIDRQNRIAELMENARTYQKQQRYEAALGQLESLLALDPQHDEALTLKQTLEDTIFWRKQLAVEKESNKQRAELFLKTDESQIPYADEMTYPKNWREIIEKPTRTPDKPIGLDPVDANVYERLEELVDLPTLTPETSFADVITALKGSVSPPLQIQPNWKDLLEMADVEPTTPAGMDPLSGVKVRKALEVLLAGVSSEFAELNYVVDEGVILVATIETLPDKMVPRVYDVTDLVGAPANYGGMGMMMGMMGGGMGGMGMGGMGMGGMGGMGMGGMGGSYGGMGGMGMGGMGGMGGMMGGMGGGYGGGMGGMGGGYGGGMGGMGGMMGGGMGGMGMGGMGGYGGGMGGMGGMMGGMGGMGGMGMMGGMGGMMGGMGGMSGLMQSQSLVNLIQESIEPDTWYDLSDTGEGTITPYPTQSPKKLAILQTHEVHNEIEKLLEALRKALGEQVSIEARFLVVTENFLEDVGLDVDFTINAGTHWGTITVEQNSVLSSQADTATKVGGSLGGIQASASVSGGYGSILDDLQVAFLLRATQAHIDSKSLIEPKVTVLSGESASFSVQDMISYALPPDTVRSRSRGFYAGGDIQDTLQQQNVMFTQVGTMLSISPTISADKKYVLLNIVTRLTDLLRFQTHDVSAIVQDANDEDVLTSYPVTVPETETSSVMTRVSVPDGGTLLLGGQKITAEIDKESGIPILSKIPILGRLFGSRSKLRDQKILLILVKPTIMLQEERESEAIAALENQF
jgi:Flp pilus assembly secretin CpaC/tetratricopeptide (TPR) repeat protein